MAKRQLPIGEPIQVLLVTDPQHGERLRGALRGSDAEFRIERTANLHAALRQATASPPDVIILDLAVHLDGEPPLQRLRQAAPSAAIIVLAGGDGDTEALRSVHAGAQDYLGRDQLDPALLVRSVRYAIERQRLVSELEQRMRALELSEAGLRRIITTTLDGIVIVDAEGQIRFVNPAAERMFGRPVKELLGEPFGFPLVAGETEDVDIVTGRGQTLVAELRVTDTEWQGAPARLVSLRDMTERRRAEEQARELIREQAARAEAQESERRARFIGECSAVLAESLDYTLTLPEIARCAIQFLADWCIIDLVDDDGHVERVVVAQADPVRHDLARRVLAAGADVARLCGITEALTTGTTRRGRPDPELIASIAADPEADRELLEMNLGDLLIVPLRNRLRTLGCITLLSFAPDRYGPRDASLAEELARRVGTAVDNSRLYREAQRANQAKADFLAVVSHELRTPLNAVIGYGDLLLLGVQGDLSHDQRDYIDRIRNSARHLLMLIEEILTFTRTEAGREQVHVSPIIMSDLAREVSDITEPLALAKNIEYRLTFQQDLTMDTDVGKVKQVLVNLLSNAVKFTDTGQVHLEITGDDELIEFRVTDSGPGIRPEHLDRIFEPFWQAEQSRTRRSEGTGLGLAVARRLARILGGDIQVDSQLGLGTMFTVRLPRHTIGSPAD